MKTVFSAEMMVNVKYFPFAFFRGRDLIKKFSTTNDGSTIMLKEPGFKRGGGVT